MKRILLLFLIIFLQIFIIANDDKISSLFLSKALEAEKENDLNLANAFLNKSLEYSEKNSDAVFLKAKIDPEISVKQKISDLEKSLQFNNWRYFEKLDSVLYLSKLLNQTFKYKESLELLQKFFNEYKVNEEYVTAYCTIAAETYNKQDSIDLLKISIDQFPLNIRLHTLQCKLDPSYRQMIRNKIFEDAESIFINNDILMIIMTNEKNLEYKEKLLKIYFENNGKNPAAYIEKLKLNNLKKNSINNDAMLVDNFLQSEWFKEKEYINIFYKSLGSKANKKKIIDFFSKYSGNIYSGFIDENSFKEKYVFENGKLIQYFFDANRDNEYECFIKSNETIKNIYVFKENLIQDLEYGKYPYLSSVKISENNKQYNYKIVPQSLKNEYVKFIPAEVFNYIILNENIFGNNIYAKYASNTVISEFDINSKIIRLNENNYKKEIDFNHDTFIDKIFYYKNNELESEYFDMNSDGFFEIVKIYDSNRLKLIKHDLNNNNIYELLIKTDNSIIKQWDYNEDGIIDFIEKNTKEVKK